MANENISVIKIGDILLVTMPPNPDDVTISLLQEKVLTNLEQYQSKGLILDISLVETLDSFFARTLTETALMIRLMGGRMIVAGMQPSVAITATQLGLSLGKAVAALDVDRALAMFRDGDSQGSLR